MSYPFYIARFESSSVSCDALDDALPAHLRSSVSLTARCESCGLPDVVVRCSSVSDLRAIVWHLRAFADRDPFYVVHRVDAPDVISSLVAYRGHLLMPEEAFAPISVPSVAPVGVV